jgi:hypothetical protein
MGLWAPETAGPAERQGEKGGEMRFILRPLLIPILAVIGTILELGIEACIWTYGWLCPETKCPLDNDDPAPPTHPEMPHACYVKDRRDAARIHGFKE